MKNWLEVIALVIAAGAMAFSALQTMVLIRTIDAPYKSNLQVRQIDACAGLIEAYSAYEGSPEWYSVASFTARDEVYSLLDPDLAVPMPEEPPNDQAQEDQQADAGSAPPSASKLEAMKSYTGIGPLTPDYRGEVLAQIGKLRVYAADDTIRKLEDLRLAVFRDRSEAINRARDLADQISAGDYSWVDNTKGAASEKPSRATFEIVESRCRSVMLGEDVGFL